MSARGPVSAVVVGAGSRGSTYAGFAGVHPERLRVVGVAEPRPYYRERLAAAHAIPPAARFDDWRALADLPRLADAAIIATPDARHEAPAVALAARGYHLLLEKPMAPTPAGCRAIVGAVEAAGVMLAVCHVLRYTPFTRTLRALLDEGRIGDVVALQRLEPIGFWHQAHSFVRGNWRREADSSPALLAKSCHDLDWIRYIIGTRCTALSSFGALKHFRAAERPPGAAARCLDCEIEPDCPYSAPRLYLGCLERGITGWPVDVITEELTREGVLAALRDGPYGRCVYDCDNDVVDHQVVALEFEGRRHADFSMMAFTELGPRRTRIFGTRGEIEGDGRGLRLYDFMTGRWEEIPVPEIAPGSPLAGHGGGDYALMDAFVSALATGDSGSILSGPRETLESHLMVFAAEQARRERRVVTMEGEWAIG